MNVFFFFLLLSPWARACFLCYVTSPTLSRVFFFTFLFFKKKKKEKRDSPFFLIGKKKREEEIPVFFSSILRRSCHDVIYNLFIYLKIKSVFFFVFFFLNWQMHNGNEIINFLLNIWTLTNREKVHFLSHRVAFWNLFWKTNELNITRKEKSYSTFEPGGGGGGKTARVCRKKKREFRSRSCVCVCVCAYFCLLQRPLC